MADIVPKSASSTFPGCALSCTTLLQAQDQCYPPNVAQSNQAGYNQCFCTIGTVNAFYSTPDGVCAAECTIESDRVLLQSWYKNFCVEVSQGKDPTTQTGGATTATSTVTATLSTDTNGPTYTGASSSEGTSSSSAAHNWFQGHWKWVLMVIVLVIGFALLTVILVWIKRRHRKKMDDKRKAASGFNHDSEKRPAGPKRVATPELWGPHQMMQATQGYQYTTDGVMAESSEHGSTKNNRKAGSRDIDVDRIESARATSPQFSKRTNKRARPTELENNARLIGAADRLSKSKKDKLGQVRMTDREIEASLQGKPRPKPRKHQDPEKT